MRGRAWYREGTRVDRGGWCCRYCHCSFTRYRHPRLTFTRFAAHRFLRHHRIRFDKLDGRVCMIQHDVRPPFLMSVIVDGTAYSWGGGVTWVQDGAA